MVVARRLARNFPGALRGAEIALASDLPSAAGNEQLKRFGRGHLHGAERRQSAVRTPRIHAAEIRSTEDLAGYLGCIENGQSYRSLTGDSGVGTFGGSEDHTAILTSQPGHLKQYAFCPVRLERTVRLPADCVFVIAVSGVVADKTGSARAHYNRASEATKTILELWRSGNGSSEQTLAEVAAGADEPTQRVCQVLRQAGAGAESQWLCNRFEQFWLESEVIIPQAFDALARGDLRSFRRVGRPIASRSRSAAGKPGSRNHVAHATSALAGRLRCVCVRRGIRRKRLGAGLARGSDKIRRLLA